MRNESLTEQIDGRMQNRALGKELAKEHEWCDKRIAELEAALSAGIAAVTYAGVTWAGSEHFLCMAYAALKGSTAKETGK